MKPSEHTTSEPLGPVLRLMCSWVLSLHLLHERLAPLFARPEVRHHALLYLQALLSDIPRKNGWQIAEQARQARPYGIQRLLSRAVWDEDGLRDELRTFVRQTLLPPPLFPTSPAAAQVFPVLVMDESASPNGAATPLASLPSIAASAARWRTVRSVFSSLTSQSWAMPSSIANCTCPKTGVPICPASSPRISPRRFPFRPSPNWPNGWWSVPRLLTCPSAGSWPIQISGHSPDLRLWVEEQGYSYAMAVPSIEVVCVQTRAGLLLSDVASIARQALRAREWQHHTPCQGTKGERL